MGQRGLLLRRYSLITLFNLFRLTAPPTLRETVIPNPVDPSGDEVKEILQCLPCILLELSPLTVTRKLVLPLRRTDFPNDLLPFLSASFKTLPKEFIRRRLTAWRGPWRGGAWWWPAPPWSTYVYGNRGRFFFFYSMVETFFSFYPHSKQGRNIQLFTVSSRKNDVLDFAGITRLFYSGLVRQYLQIIMFRELWFPKQKAAELGDRSINFPRKTIINVNTAGEGGLAVQKHFQLPLYSLACK